MPREPPYIANELLDQVMAAAYDLHANAYSSSELIPRKSPATFREFSSFANASLRFRQVALRAWFVVYTPHTVEEVDPDGESEATASSVMHSGELYAHVRLASHIMAEHGS